METRKQRVQTAQVGAPRLAVAKGWDPEGWVEEETASDFKDACECECVIPGAHSSASRLVCRTTDISGRMWRESVAGSVDTHVTCPTSVGASSHVYALHVMGSIRYTIPSIFIRASDVGVGMLSLLIIRQGSERASTLDGGLADPCPGPALGVWPSRKT